MDHPRRMVFLWESKWDSQHLWAESTHTILTA
jgi:hypothetical protein